MHIDVPSVTPRSLECRSSCILKACGRCRESGTAGIILAVLETGLLYWGGMHSGRTFWTEYDSSRRSATPCRCLTHRIFSLSDDDSLMIISYPCSGCHLIARYRLLLGISKLSTYTRDSRREMYIVQGLSPVSCQHRVYSLGYKVYDPYE